MESKSSVVKSCILVLFKYFFYLRLRLNREILSIKFSPDSKHFALTKEDNVFVYKSPGPYTNDYSPFVMEKILKVQF